jgi:hypothetical protein
MNLPPKCNNNDYSLYCQLVNHFFWFIMNKVLLIYTQYQPYAFVKEPLDLELALIYREVISEPCLIDDDVTI